MKAQNQSLRSLYGATAIAAIIGGVILDLKLIVIDHAPVPGLWQFIASTMFGPVAFSNTAYALVGLIMHFITSFFWAYLYLFVWSRINSLQNWIVGGLVWGVVAMIGMTAFLVVKGVMPMPTMGWPVLSSLIGHTIFFGLPVAWYIARSARAR